MFCTSYCLVGDSLKQKTQDNKFQKFVDRVWNVTLHARKLDFVFRAERTSPFKSAGGGISSVDCWQPRCAPSAVVMLDTPCSEVVWRVLATHSIRQFPLHFPSRASPCAITFQLESTYKAWLYTTFYKSILKLSLTVISTVATPVSPQSAACIGCRGRNIFTRTVIPRLTKIIRSGITFVSRNLR